MTLDIVKEYFEGPSYRGKPAVIIDYCRHALRPDGPAWFKVPTPYECTVLRGSPGYIVRILPLLPYAYLRCFSRNPMDSS
jgi:hypothetical protein